MAPRAFRSEGALVDVLVAARAGRVEADPALRGVAPLGQARGGRQAQLRLVAIGAPKLAVFSRKGPAGPAVIEIARPLRGPAREREIDARMIRVAACAFGLPLARVQAARVSGQPDDLLVTRKALGIEAAFSGAVALEALRAPFEAGMRAGEGTRRDLGMSGREAREKQRERNRDADERARSERRAAVQNAPAAPTPAPGIGTSFRTIRTPVRCRKE